LTTHKKRDPPDANRLNSAQQYGAIDGQIYKGVVNAAQFDVTDDPIDSMWMALEQQRGSC
jgi:hypothetical protein